ncbi:MAG: PIN domain-containing protein [Candidatus Hodarchaeota archaeon]
MIILCVLLDANFLMMSGQFKINIFSELDRIIQSKYVPVVLTQTINELERLLDNEKPKIRQQASLALRMVENCEVREAKCLPNESVDSLIMRYAKENKCVVSTNDKKLRKKLRKNLIAVVYLRKKAFLAMDGNIP